MPIKAIAGCYRRLLAKFYLYMKHIKTGLIATTLIMSIIINAFTTAKSITGTTLQQEAWYRYNTSQGGDSQDPASYDQTHFTRSDPQALVSCPPGPNVCAAKFLEGESGEPTGEPISIINGFFEPGL